MGRNDLKGAERVLQRVIKLEGADGECYCSLGGLRERQGNLTAAEAAYREAVSLEPNGYESCLELGRLLENKGDKRGAETVYREALQELPDFASRYAKRHSADYSNILVNEFPSLRKLFARYRLKLFLLLILTYFYMISSSPCELRGRRLPRSRRQFL